MGRTYNYDRPKLRSKRPAGKLVMEVSWRCLCTRYRWIGREGELVGSKVQGKETMTGTPRPRIGSYVQRCKIEEMIKVIGQERPAE